MQLRDIMARDVQTVDVNAPIWEAANSMREDNVSCLVVVDGDNVVGVLTERDLVLGCLIDGHISWDCQVYRHMKVQDDVARPETILANAVVTMIESELDNLPVVGEDGSVVGLVTSSEFSRAITMEMNESYGETTAIF